ncbi:MAG: cupin domain-containing protein [Candidatus Marinimicrobia bacterium]|nr:cupin domain-containing protein [Candidatus Neomarinimicrobiota bacterium]
MIILNKANAPRYVRPEDITSYLLTSKLTGSEHLTTTLVEISSGGMQRIHNHVPEQIYYILEGSGLMTVGNETARVEPGDCIFIPSQALHGLKNKGEITLRYFSAAAPSFDSEELKTFWPLGSESE